MLKVDLRLTDAKGHSEDFAVKFKESVFGTGEWWAKANRQVLKVNAGETVSKSTTLGFAERGDYACGVILYKFWPERIAEGMPTKGEGLVADLWGNILSPGKVTWYFLGAK